MEGLSRRTLSIVVSVARRTLRQRYDRISTYQNKLGATNPGESHGSRGTVHHWLHSVLGTDLSRKQQSSSQSHRDRDAQLISRLDFIWLAGGLAMGRHRQLREMTIEESEKCPGSLQFVFRKPPGPAASKRIITSSRSPVSLLP
jgi:hypothetical protein